VYSEYDFDPGDYAVHWVLVAALSIHVLAAVFWAGSTFAVARAAGGGFERLFGPQMAAAAVAVLSGGYLWHLLHEGAVGRAERILAIAAVSAIVALAVQGLVTGVALSGVRRRVIEDEVAKSRVAIAYRAAAVLLAVTVIGMAAARYA
jgi:hypothetical protein